jgi:hypothetical protein
MLIARRGGVLAILAVLSIVALATAGSASAFEGGGRSPSVAPLINWGQHYSGELNNRKEDANDGYHEIALYRLPPVSSHDQVVVNWHELPYASGGFPVCMTLAQGINDFNWGTVFGELEYDECGGAPVYGVSGSGTAQTSITVQNTDSTGTFLEFFSYAEETNSSRYKTYPYDFTVEAPRHALTLNFPGVQTVAANGTLAASVTGATGLPGPDGLVYTLTANWGNSGVWIGTAASVGGQIVFPLALPESAVNERVRFIVSRAPDSAYQAVESPPMKAKVTAPVAPAPPPVSKACTKAKSRAHVLARQFHRLTANSHRARGWLRRKLNRRASEVGHELHTARAKAARACGK